MGHNEQCRACMYENACNNISCRKMERNVILNEGYCDGHGQAIENVRYNLLAVYNKNGKITAEDVNKICDFCSEIDEEYLIQ